MAVRTKAGVAWYRGMFSLSVCFIFNVLCVAPEFMLRVLVFERPRQVVCTHGRVVSRLALIALDLKSDVACLIGVNYCCVAYHTAVRCLVFYVRRRVSHGGVSQHSSRVSQWLSCTEKKNGGRKRSSNRTPVSPIVMRSCLNYT